VTVALVPQVAGGQAAQLVVDERQQRLERLWLATVPGQEQLCRSSGCIRDAPILCRFALDWQMKRFASDAPAGN
jgi:hypothetical protein